MIVIKVGQQLKHQSQSRIVLEEGVTDWKPSLKQNRVPKNPMLSSGSTADWLAID